MIPVPRLPEPSVLTKNSDRWLSKLQAIQATPKATNQQISNARDKYRHPKIKETLNKMFHGKCAYCESKITVVTYGAIEHFFPKSLYPSLTFEWKNLLLSCDKCNDTNHKGTKFSLDDAGKPLLIDPTDGITDPNTHLDFVWDETAKIASIYGRDEKGMAVESIFDLNGTRGRIDLIDHRSRYIDKLLILLRFAKQGDSKAIAALVEACQPDAEYSSFARIYIAPHLETLFNP